MKEFLIAFVASLSIGAMSLMTTNSAEARWGYRHGGWRGGWAYGGWVLGATGAFAGGVAGATVGPYGFDQYLPYHYYYGRMPAYVYVPVYAPIYSFECSC